MNGARVDFVAEARREVDEAFAWYLDRSPVAAESLVEHLDEALELVSAAPEAWPRYEVGTRRLVLRKFPYSLIFREIEGRLQVVAFAHHKRKPMYWYPRLSQPIEPTTG